MGFKEVQAGKSRDLGKVEMSGCPGAETVSVL